ncbi:MAG TPA: hypothetical protein PK331_04495 [Gordonia sp. (in: high G+C Gram-positive bacteria)]|uniref:hypothetical protein n=1 Tax=unclassified Gordonia (in: high G+C Gram-positive bacteria) TaxID=2657482 RepID=UPI000FAE3AD3|nr:MULTISPECIES: hypothetical protein [unclassified Gordonia (in: high G+C Gram-positive bacteria)]RUP40081.1 MAG: hypothetical protein EKK60_04880 [Gordonia sp. (in: high G+C Gram-positive bacteria)]HNP57199.1 hypothetical protein [Gordonia sp. (in: high G+C Gram-positive bacteria)]HRC50173.1 hypothetical protein [Gordonia sp. (in: high G+C Gram-positive bacteria)]
MTDTARRPSSPYADLSSSQLATLLPELLLSGQLIDRSGMAHLISAFGREVMTEVAIEEWMAASPVYTGRMRSALGIDGDGVVDMFKCLQLDIGAPPQFMDFRYVVHDEYHGGFILSHCGALMDVEPMGDEYVTSMCHDIEDPTFDATAIATNRRARIRPVHRPPRVPTDRTPHCEWTVTIEPDRDELPLPEFTKPVLETAAATVALSPIDQTATDGHVDYRGDLVEDLVFSDFSHTALVRMAEEVALQHHLLAIGFRLSVLRRDVSDRDGHGAASRDEQARRITGLQLIGISGMASERLRDALRLGDSAADLATVLRAHPILGPQQYTGVVVEETDAGVRIRIPQDSPAFGDGGWMDLLTPEFTDPLAAMVAGVDSRWTVDSASYADGDLVVDVVRGEPHREADEVAIVRFSSGSNFEFTNRGRAIPIIPITPVG